ncbi:hypothetical protein MPH_14042, partial [Macrophomina phaseolina MS6]
HMVSRKILAIVLTSYIKGCSTISTTKARNYLFT